MKKASPVLRISRALAGCMLILLASGCISQAPSIESDGMWTLVWQDEFDGKALDPAKWDYYPGNGFWSGEDWISGWGNNELEYYTDRVQNVSVSNGTLKITALKENFTGEAGGREETFQYTSGKLVSQGLFSKVYGKFEFRARFPQGKGLWPAIWMMPEEDTYGPWAASGEIDIFEGRGSNTNRVSGAIHYGATWPDNRFSTKDYFLPDNGSTTDFHIYTLEWEPGELRWYVDGHLYQTQNRWFSKNRTYPAPFNRKFYFLLNLAVGGHFDGDPDNSTVFPGVMEVDYARVYELTGRPYRFPEPPPLEIPPEPRPAEARPAGAEGNEIYNGSFSEENAEEEGVAGVEGTDWWVFMHLPDFMGSGNLSIEKIESTNFARIDITGPGNQPFSIQLIQYVPLIKGHKYVARFKAKASAPRKIQFKINGDEDNSWVTYSTIEAPALTEEITGYEYSFTMQHDTDLEARFEINAGNNRETVWIGDVQLKDITEGN